jgi:hypothetical protein
MYRIVARTIASLGLLSAVAMGVALEGCTNMRVHNVHERRIAATPAQVGALLDTLGSSDDRFWPHENWPAIKLDRALQVGAVGGHGTEPYEVVSYAPGKHVRFEFRGGRRYGYHEFTLEDSGDGRSLLRHTMQAQVQFSIRTAFFWYALIRPLHNALLEDLLDKVEGQVGRLESPQVWSVAVRWLRQKRGFSPIKNQGRPVPSGRVGP